MKTFKVLLFFTKLYLKYHLSTTIHISCILGEEFIQTLLIQSGIIHFLMGRQKTLSYKFEISQASKTSVLAKYNGQIHFWMISFI